MVAPKKTIPFSRLRGSRSRKNGSCGHRASTTRKSLKSSVEHESSRVASHKCVLPFPPYFTVDDLAAYRRRRVPCKYLDTLRPLSGQFADICTEYRSAYRSFIVAPDDSIMNWKKKKMKPQDCQPEPESPQQPAAGKAEPPAEQYIRHPKTRSIRPTDNIEKPEAFCCNASSETKDKYVTLPLVKPAPLMRQPTHLQVSGEFDGASETKAKYTGHSASSKVQLLRRDTQLHLEGDMELASESAVSFLPIENPERARLLRRHSTLELPAACACGSSSEYHREFRYPEHYERARLMRSLENLRADGEMEFQPEYATNFVDFQVAYPQVRYRERRRSLVEAHRSRQEKQCELKTALVDRTSRPSYSPEYRHSYVQFPARRPTLQRPHTNLVPPSGIGETESELKAQLREVWQPKSARAVRPSSCSKDVNEGGNSPSRSQRDLQEQQLQGKENWREKPFCILPENGSETGRKNVNFTNAAGRPPESAFRKGKRLPVTKSCSQLGPSESPNLETGDSTRPTFRLEVTNPDHKQRAFERAPGNAPFVVLDENNNTNQWVKNKENRKKWTPSWLKG